MQFERYKKVLGKKCPRNYTEFCKLKKDEKLWKEMQSEYKNALLEKKNSGRLELGKKTGKIITRTLSEVAESSFIIKRVKDIRSKLTSGMKKSGNIAIADVNIIGLGKTQFYASNKINTLTKTLEKRITDISLKPSVADEIFMYSTELTADGRRVARNVDSEYKILNDIAKRLGDNPKVVGTVRLFTELVPCPSCSNVIEQFTKKYPRVEFELIHNSGNRLIK